MKCEPTTQNYIYLGLLIVTILLQEWVGRTKKTEAATIGQLFVVLFVAGLSIIISKFWRNDGSSK